MAAVRARPLSSTRISAIVLAAGSGSRLGEPKQFVEWVPGVRLVDVAVDAVFAITDSVILVLPPGHAWEGRRVDATVPGSATRLQSVSAGLSALGSDPEIVVVHDAVHPLASRQTFLDVIAAVSEGADAAVPLLPLADVVKREDRGDRLITVGRDGLGLAQVPMAFLHASLLAAQGAATDDAWEDSMLVERAGGRVVGVAGSSRNIHVVTQEDLDMARALAEEGLET